MTGVTQVDRSTGAKVGAMVKVCVDLCKQCGICIGLCPNNVFDRAPDGTPVPNVLADCNACRTCELHCPEFAISVSPQSPERAISVSRQSADAGAAPEAD